MVDNAERREAGRPGTGDGMVGAEGTEDGRQGEWMGKGLSDRACLRTELTTRAAEECRVSAAVTALGLMALP